MSKTGIERLRGLYVEWLGGNDLVALSDMIQETADQIEREHAEGLAALEPRLMPEGLTWPRWDDGSMITAHDAPEYVEFVAIALDGMTYGLYEEIDGPSIVCGKIEDRVKRPKMLAADGLPIEVGDTVWFVDCESCDEFVSENLSFRDEMRVVEINRGSKRPVVVQHAHGSAVGFCKPNSITHARPDTQERTCRDDGVGVFRCTACGAFAKRSAVMDLCREIPIRYCPNCGAKVVS